MLDGHMNTQVRLKKCKGNESEHQFSLLAILVPVLYAAEMQQVFSVPRKKCPPISTNKVIKELLWMSGNLETEYKSLEDGRYAKYGIR